MDDQGFDEIASVFGEVDEPTNPPDERLLSILAELTVRIEKLEEIAAKTKTALPQIPW